MALKLDAGVIRSRVAFDELDGLLITIPAVTSWPFAIFLGVWLCGWAVGEALALGTLSLHFLGLSIGPQFTNNTPIVFLLLWTLGWTVGGLFVLDALVWQFRGREVNRIDDQSIVTSRVGSLFPRRTRTFDLSDVTNLRFAPLAYVAFPRSFSDYREGLGAQMQMIGTGGGSVAFDHGGKTHRFGIQLSESEARRLIKTIEDRYKIEEDKDEALPVERM